jgi:hypothetical protein
MWWSGDTLLSGKRCAGAYSILIEVPSYADEDDRRAACELLASAVDEDGAYYTSEMAYCIG